MAMAERIFHAVRLYLRSPLHMGRGRSELAKSLRLPTSDGIKAALHACALRLFPDGEVMAHLHEALRFSAVFPSREGRDYLPVPLSGLRCREADPAADYALQKQLRKLAYLPKPAFSAALHGARLSKAELDLEGKYLRESLSQRVAVPPPGMGLDATPYHVALLRPEEGASLYFLVEGLDADSEVLLRAALQLLQDEGIGLGRSIGYGAFDWEIEADWRLRVPEESGHWCFLGSYLPAAEGWSPDSLAGGAWKLELCGGYVSSAVDPGQRSLRRRGLYMFQPGSVLPQQGPPKGLAKDLRPAEMQDSHPVWRDGRGISIPIKI